MAHDNSTAAVARIEQKLDSLNERLFNGGSGVLLALAAAHKETAEDVAQLKIDHVVLATEVKKDAKWIAAIFSAVGVAISSAVHFFGGK